MPLPLRRLLIVTGTVLAGLIVIGAIAGALNGAGSEHDVQGTMSLYADAPSYLDSGDSCSGTGGYSDIDVGTRVVVRDGAGEVLGTSRLGPGHYDGGACVFTFVVSDVPKADFYAVEVSARGELEYSYDEMVGNDWTVLATLGD